jgi:hypothetical protein
MAQLDTRQPWTGEIEQTSVNEFAWSRIVKWSRKTVDHHKNGGRFGQPNDLPGADRDDCRFVKTSKELGVMDLDFPCRLRPFTGGV